MLFWCSVLTGVQYFMSYKFMCFFFIHIILAKNSTTVIGNFVATRLYKLSIKRIQSLVSFLISATRRPLPVGKSAKQGRRMLDYWPNVCCSSNRKLQMCKQHTANYKATPLCSGGSSYSWQFLMIFGLFNLEDSWTKLWWWGRRRIR